jgi:hypothetical protein
MLLFLLTAREGRVSANHLGCPSSPNPQTRPRSPYVPRRRTRVSRAPAQGLSYRQNRQYCGYFMSALTVAGPVKAQEANPVPRKMPQE